MPGRSSPSIPSLASARHGNQRYNYQSLPRYPSGRIIRRTPELEANRLPPIGENGPAAEELPQHWIWSYLTTAMRLAWHFLLAGFLVVVFILMMVKILGTILLPAPSDDEPIYSWIDSDRGALCICGILMMLCLILFVLFISQYLNILFRRTFKIWWCHTYHLNQFLTTCTLRIASRCRKSMKHSIVYKESAIL